MDSWEVGEQAGDDSDGDPVDENKEGCQSPRHFL